MNSRGLGRIKPLAAKLAAITRSQGRIQSLAGSLRVEHKVFTLSRCKRAVGPVREEATSSKVAIGICTTRAISTKRSVPLAVERRVGIRQTTATHTRRSSGWRTRWWAYRGARRRTRSTRAAAELLRFLSSSTRSVIHTTLRTLSTSHRVATSVG